MNPSLLVLLEMLMDCRRSYPRFAVFSVILGQLSLQRQLQDEK